MNKLSFFVLTLFSFQFVAAQNEDSIFIKRISDEILTNGKAYEHLRVLTKQVRAQAGWFARHGKSRTMGIKSNEGKWS